MMFRRGEEEREKIIKKCLLAFPYMWFFVRATACLSSLLLSDLSYSVSACQDVGVALFALLAAC